MTVKIVQSWVAGKANVCLACRTLKERAREVLDKMGLSDTSIELCENQDEFDEYGVIVTPMLLINGKVKSMGKVPTTGRLKQMIEEETTPAETS